jgi:lysophospholipase L1-like esterase
MKKIYIPLLLIISFSFQLRDTGLSADPANYLNDIKTELTKDWPENRIINVVFHGHSVPAGYFRTPVVNTLGAYPYQVLKGLKSLYPTAVINIINTSIGGENAEKGAERFESNVMPHQPDVLFIDYALNDRSIGLEKAAEAWEKMIKIALKSNIKVILLTPSPDQRVNLSEPNNELEKHSIQIRNLATKYDIGLVDSYNLFRQKVALGENVAHYMSQVNHPNEKGHELIANEILTYFK